MATTEERLDKLETTLDAEKRFAGLDARVSTLEKIPKDNCLVVLGNTLKIPMSWVFLAALVIVAVFLAFFIWAGPEKRVSEILVTVFHYNPNSKQVGQDKNDAISAIYTLVTPHEKTLEDLQTAKPPLDPPLTPEEIKYYTFDHDALAGFASDLLKEGAQGYSRREVWGEGHRPLKRGWEWTITWRADRPISDAQLVALYEHYFHRKDGIYIEEKRVGPTLYAKSKE
jgi:hypothetical protein